MRSWKFTEQALDDLARLQDFLLENDPQAAEATTALIANGLEVLMAHPLIGRPTQDETRELVISRGRTGYVALYKYQAEHDRIVLVALRHQRETGFDE